MAERVSLTSSVTGRAKFLPESAGGAAGRVMLQGWDVEERRLHSQAHSLAERTYPSSESDDKRMKMIVQNVFDCLEEGGIRWYV